MVISLGCILDEKHSGESMATKMLGNINGKLKFLYRKQSFLDNSLCRLLSNALIQPHFDYACTSWFPMLNKRLSKNAISAEQMNSLLFESKKRSTCVGATEFKAINWLPTKNRVDQHTCLNIMKFFKGWLQLMLTKFSNQFSKDNFSKIYRERKKWVYFQNFDGMII